MLRVPSLNYLVFAAIMLVPTRGPAQPWMTAPTAEDAPNLWQAFRKQVTVSDEELMDYRVAIAADSKYWLYVNDSLVVREGGLKRGPRPETYYVDTLNLGPYLKAGENTVAILLWYFGKQGFSHQSSGLPGLWIDGPEQLRSSADWRAIVHPAFGHTGPPRPNYRLPESNILFDANRYDEDWTAADYDDSLWPPARIYARHPSPRPTGPGELDLAGARGQYRPIPQWIDSGLQDYPDDWQIRPSDTLRLRLPYNAQITPYFRVRAPRAGMRIELLTDNYRGGGPPNVRTVYYTRAGEQSFETPGWMNGHEVWYIIPAGVEILELKYRESGYATDFTGSFVSCDTALNVLWQKAARTLYLTMRDTYMDCPDRERAQWWGDVVNEIGETFYVLDRRSDALSRKAIRELMYWQRPDSTIFSPVPAGNWDKELPMQMLASVGYYGIWHYYFNTGDRRLLEEIYPAMKRYVGVWQTDEQGLVIPRQGGWTWGDRGNNKDLTLLYNCWYYLALKGLHHAAEVVGDTAQVTRAADRMQRMQEAFHPTFWNGSAYRSADYQGATDDRPHALAVVSGLAPVEVYPEIFTVLREQAHASPYMEKYVLEALCRMGKETYAIKRAKQRFGKMIESELTTLWEGWGIGSEGYGGGSYNHAWSGGGLTIMSQFLGGIEPAEAGWQALRLQPAGWPLLDWTKTVVPSPRGPISVEWTYHEDRGLHLSCLADFAVDYVEVSLPAGWSFNPQTLAGERIPVERQPGNEGKTIYRLATANFNAKAN